MSKASDDASSLKSVPSSESFRVYRSGGGTKSTKTLKMSFDDQILTDIPAETDDESDNDSEGSSSAVEDTSSSTDEDGSSQQGGDSDSDDSQSSNGATSNGKVRFLTA